MFRALLCPYAIACSQDTTPAYVRLTSNLQQRKKETTSVVISRELLVMSIVVPETCLAYKKCNKIISSIYLALFLQLITWFTLQRKM